MARCVSVARCQGSGPNDRHRGRARRDGIRSAHRPADHQFHDVGGVRARLCRLGASEYRPADGGTRGWTACDETFDPGAGPCRPGTALRRPERGAGQGPRSAGPANGSAKMESKPVRIEWIFPACRTGVPAVPLDAVLASAKAASPLREEGMRCAPPSFDCQTAKLRHPCCLSGAGYAVLRRAPARGAERRQALARNAVPVARLAVGPISGSPEITGR